MCDAFGGKPVLPGRHRIVGHRMRSGKRPGSLRGRAEGQRMDKKRTREKKFSRLIDFLLKCKGFSK